MGLSACACACLSALEGVLCVLSISTTNDGVTLLTSPSILDSTVPCAISDIANPDLYKNTGQSEAFIALINWGA